MMVGMLVPVPDNESIRLETLRQYSILDTLPEQSYNDIVELAAHICDTPIAAVNFIDKTRQWSKASLGLDTQEILRENSFCTYTILAPDRLTIVPQALDDERFSNNPFVTGPGHLRFYAGAPLVTSTGEAVGALCVAAYEARTLSDKQQQALAALARQVMSQLSLRQQQAQLEAQQKNLEYLNASLALQSTTDALTGLANRRAFDTSLESELERVRRYGGAYSLLMIDVDAFKLYNDSFGHPAGDDVLRKVAAILVASVRESDLVTRYGGEEFAVLAMGTELSGALMLGERCRATIESATWLHRSVTVSVGVAALTSSLETASELTAAADQALYDAKRRGRNQVMAFKAFA
jgi:diguanylate cyclase (GGDEF)-like protein